MLPPFDALLFDFDGTLAVLNLDFDLMRRRVFELAVRQDLPPDELRGLYILEMVDYATTRLEQRQSDLGTAFYHNAHQLIQDIEVEAAHGSTLLPGVHHLLDTLRQRQVGVGIVTRNCDAAVRIVFPQIDRYCQAFFARDHVTQVKPHPTHLQAALTRLRSAPTRTIMVGDGVMDIQAAKYLNMYAVGVLSGTSTRANLMQQGADLVLDSAADLAVYLPSHSGSIECPGLRYNLGSFPMPCWQSDRATGVDRSTGAHWPPRRRGRRGD
ncbi:Phosphoglycolate phosphatase [Candidatus Entotheonellaceae bacterium PAL068K]